jgi:hypothetical protein
MTKDAFAVSTGHFDVYLLSDMFCMKVWKDRELWTMRGRGAGTGERSPAQNFRRTPSARSKVGGKALVVGKTPCHNMRDLNFEFQRSIHCEILRLFEEFDNVLGDGF